VWLTGDGLGHQFITLTVDICVQHGGCESLRPADLLLSAAAEICCTTGQQLTRFQLKQCVAQFLCGGEAFLWCKRYLRNSDGIIPRTAK